MMKKLLLIALGVLIYASTILAQKNENIEGEWILEEVIYEVETNDSLITQWIKEAINEDFNYEIG